MDRTGHGRIVCSRCGVVILSCRCLDSYKIQTDRRLCDACAQVMYGGAVCDADKREAAVSGMQPEAGAPEVGR
jgi:hypothetical protein